MRLSRANIPLASEDRTHSQAISPSPHYNLAPHIWPGFINLQHFCHSRWRNPVRLSKSGLTNWCEDLGYADFYNIAFRLFGFSAFSTHWLYVSIISTSFILFTITFFRENLAIASLTLGVSALFLESSSIFSELMPSFAANRFLSTLALIPLLHLIHTILRVGPLRWAEIGVLIGQILIVSFAISARSSAQWCLFALVFSSVAVVLMRSRTGVPRLNGQDIRRFAARLAATPCVGRIGTSAAIVLVVTVGVDVVRNLQFDARY